jgi:hypothetical protein
VNAPDKPPYPGLRPFRRDESDIFFGRDDCVDEMISRLAATRFLAVLGSSGTGKSSLVKTGLLTGLEMGLSGAGANWRVVDFSPGRSAMASLAERLIQTDTTRGAGAAPPDAVEVERLRERLAHGGPRTLLEWCREGHLEPDTNLLLLVDQFEELFRYQDYAGREEAEAFVSLLLESRRPIEAAHPQLAEFPIFVAITMRSEYLGPCALIEGLAEAINEGTFLTPRMTRAQCEEAIVGPARVCGVEIEPRLVARMLNDLAKFAIGWDGDGRLGDRERSEATDQLSRLARSADQLPLMQHALNQMWQRARKTVKPGDTILIRDDDYKGLEKELDGHAESIVASLVRERGKDIEAVVETIFRAVTRGTTVWNAERRRTPYGELVALCGGKRDDVAAVVSAFAAPGAHFLYGFPATGEPPSDDKDIDISHESLIRQWKQLSKWLEKEGQIAHEWQRVDTAAEAEAARDGELMKGRDLGNALALVNEEKRPHNVLARRYGIDLPRMQSFIDRSARSRRLRWAVTAAGVAVVALLGGWIVLSEFRIADRDRHADELTKYVQKLDAAYKDLDEANKKNAGLAARNAGFRDASIALGKEMEKLAIATLTEQMQHQHQLHMTLQSDPALGPDTTSSKEFDKWRQANKQLVAPVQRIERLLETARHLEGDNVELIRQHLVTVSLLAILRDDPHGEDANREHQQAIELAETLVHKKLDFETVQSIYVSLTLLSITRSGAQPRSARPVSEGLLDRVIRYLALYTDRTKPGRAPTDVEHARASAWLAQVWLRKCDAHHSQGESDRAISACTTGMKFAREPATKARLHETLAILYEHKATNATGDEQMSWRKSAVVELRQLIGLRRSSFSKEFGELFDRFGTPEQYLQHISAPTEWARSNSSLLLAIDFVELSAKDDAHIKMLGAALDHTAISVGKLAELYSNLKLETEARASRFLQFNYRYATFRLLWKRKGMGGEADKSRREIARALIDLGSLEGTLRQFDASEKIYKACLELMGSSAKDDEGDSDSAVLDKTVVSDCTDGLKWVAAEREKAAQK